MTPRGKARLALSLWLVLAFLVWNAVFDRVIVMAGREYLVEARVASLTWKPYVRIDDWMRPAARRGVWLASASAVPIAVIGIAAVFFARRRERRSGPAGSDSYSRSSIR